MTVIRCVAGRQEAKESGVLIPTQLHRVRIFMTVSL